MQISKSFLIVCALATCVLPLSVRADTDAQIKAREALRQKMQELDTQPAETAPVPAPPVQQKQAKPAPTPPRQVEPEPVAKSVPQPKPAKVPHPKAAPAPVVAEPVTPRADSEAIAKARAAMEQKMKELDAQQPPP